MTDDTKKYSLWVEIDGIETGPHAIGDFTLSIDDPVIKKLIKKLRRNLWSNGQPIQSDITVRISKPSIVKPNDWLAVLLIEKGV